MAPVDHRVNNLDAFRLVAAITVVVGHAWPLTGRDGAPTIAGVLMSTTAVFVFFSISGYLIATSWKRSPQIVPFLRHRVARIFPALTVVIVITVFGVGPVVSTLQPQAYFHSSEPWRYLSGLLLAPTYSLPGVFTENPSSAVNGSLWTLGPEFICYLLVVAVGSMCWRFRPRLANQVQPFVFAGLACGLGAVAWAGPDSSLRAAAGAMTFFTVGAVIAYLPILRLPLWALPPIAALWLAAGLISRNAGMSAGWIAIPILVLALGLRAVPILRSAGRFGDLSYGTYVWAFPIQQLVSARFPTLPLPTNIAIVLIVTLTLATISWRLIEEPSLKWARRERTHAKDESTPHSRTHHALTMTPDGSISLDAR